MKLLDQSQAIRTVHYSIRTERRYVYWIECFIRFHQLKHPSTMGAVEVEAFLTHLAVTDHVSASTQNQALGALLFLYQCVLGIELGRARCRSCQAAGGRASRAVPGRSPRFALGHRCIADNRTVRPHGAAHVWFRIAPCSNVVTSESKTLISRRATHGPSGQRRQGSLRHAASCDLRHGSRVPIRPAANTSCEGFGSGRRARGC